MIERIQSILQENFKISLAGRRLQMVCLFGPCRMQIVGVLKELSFPSEHMCLYLKIPHPHILSLPTPGRFNLVNK